jgi:hypothetical protein
MAPLTLRIRAAEKTGRKSTKSYKLAGQPYDGGPAGGMPFVRDGRSTATMSAKTDPDHVDSGGSDSGSEQPSRVRKVYSNSSTAKDWVDG